MSLALQALKTWAINWSLAVLAAFAVLYLNAYLEHQHSETDALQRSADISNDIAAEYAASRKPALVANKE